LWPVMVTKSQIGTAKNKSFPIDSSNHTGNVNIERYNIHIIKIKTKTGKKAI